MEPNSVSGPKVFVDVDGIKQSVPWRLEDYGQSGALSEAEVVSISQEFDFPIADLRQLSVEMGRQLDPAQTPNLIGVDHQVAENRATEVLKQAHKDAHAALEKAWDTYEALLSLSPNSASDPIHSDRLKELQRDAGELVDRQQDLCRRLGYQTTEPGAAVDLRPTNKKVISDWRRKSVLKTIAFSWHRANMSGSYTTDPFTSKRQGPFLKFANAIVSCLTDPRSELSANTIAKDLKGFRESIPVLEEVLIELQKPNRHT